MRGRIGMTAAAVLVPLLVSGGCTQDKVPTAQGADAIVVHGVLNPGVHDQVILLERTLSGRTAADSSLRYDSLDAVVSRGATPVSGARVVVATDGDTVVAVEDLARRGDGKGAGMYRFVSEPRDSASSADTALLVRPGGHYTLRIETTDGATITGETTVPSATPVRVATTFHPFHRDRDSIFVYWNPIPGAARYLLRIDTPRGAFTQFVDSAEYLIAGPLRNTGLPGLPAVFVPGFVQPVTIGAVDRNYFDWYRTANDPFTGSGLVSHLHGALGVFGAYVMVNASALSVTQDFTDPVLEGDWDRVSPYVAGVPNSFRLFIESNAGHQRRLSGFWSSFATGFPPPGVLGTTDDLLHVTLALLKGQSARDTAAVLDLRPTPNHLVGHVRATGDSVDFIHRGAP